MGPTVPVWTSQRAISAHIPELSAEELHTNLVEKETEIGSLRTQWAGACVGQNNDTKADPLMRYELHELLLLQISKVLRVLNVFVQNKKELGSVLDELAGAQDQVAQQESRIAALVVAR